jgi:hypothetical protein
MVFVRRLLATAILLVFALNAIDGICCPDGCTHDNQSTVQQHGDLGGAGSCMLCLGGTDSAGVHSATCRTRRRMSVSNLGPAMRSSAGTATFAVRLHPSRVTLGS